MESIADHPPLRLAAREIPVPTSISEQAQTMLSMGVLGAMSYPPLDDHSGWRELITMMDSWILPMMEARTSGDAVNTAELIVDAAKIFVASPVNAPAERIYLDFHSGALIMGGGALCRLSAIAAATRLGVRVWSVDYRMPPDNPYPAALNDGMAAYRALLRDYDPQNIIVGGSSAGGNLAAALILRARDEGLPLPAAVVLHTPEVDLTESGDSFHTNLGIDNVAGSLMPVNKLYAGSYDLAHPYLSPLFGSFDAGFPPTLLAAGTRDLFLSNTVRMHRALRAANVAAELHILEAAPHGGFGGAPEDLELEREIRRFVDSHWKNI